MCPVELASFVTWFLQYGGYLHPLVELKLESARGVYMRVREDASEPLLEGTIVIKCPHHLRLSAQDAISQTIPRKDESYHALPQSVRNAAATPQLVGAIWLSHQYLLGSKSPWYPYIALLPRPVGDVSSSSKVKEIDTPLFWPDTDIVPVKNVNLWKGLHDLTDLWHAQWQKVEPQLRLWNDPEADPITWPLFKWALATLGSRAFTAAWFSTSSKTESQPSGYDPHMFLYPGIDLLNYYPTTKNRWVNDGDSFCIRCDDKPKPGEEVFNWYGNKGNTELLLSYGFTVSGNPHDTFAVKLKEQEYPIIDKIRRAQFDNKGQEDEISACARDPKSQEATMQGIQQLPPDFALLRNPSPSLAGYPNTSFAEYVTKSDNVTPQFAGMPMSPLSKLAESTANSHEKARIDHKPSQFSPEGLFRQLGPRVELRVTALLAQLLHRERGKIRNAFRALSGHTTDRTDNLRNQYIQDYLIGQRLILDAILTNLDETLDVASVSPRGLVVNTQNSTIGAEIVTQRYGQLLLTLDAATSALGEIDPIVHKSFVSGLNIITNGGSDAATTRHKDCEFEVWAIWLQILYQYLSTSQSTSDTSIHLVQRLKKWVTFLEERYDLRFGSSSNEVEGGFAQEEERAYVDYIQDLVHSIRSYSSKETRKIWNSQQWDNADLIVRCKRVIDDEGLDTPVLDTDGSLIGVQRVLYIPRS